VGITGLAGIVTLKGGLVLGKTVAKGVADRTKILKKGKGNSRIRKSDENQCREVCRKCALQARGKGASLGQLARGLEEGVVKKKKGRLFPTKKKSVEFTCGSFARVCYV